MRIVLALLLLSLVQAGCASAPAVQSPPEDDFSATDDLRPAWVIDGDAGVDPDSGMLGFVGVAVSPGGVVKARQNAQRDAVHQLLRYVEVAFDGRFSRFVYVDGGGPEFGGLSSGMFPPKYDKKRFHANLARLLSPGVKTKNYFIEQGEGSVGHVVHRVFCRVVIQRAAIDAAVRDMAAEHVADFDRQAATLSAGDVQSATLEKQRDFWAEVQRSGMGE